MTAPANNVIVSCNAADGAFATDVVLFVSLLSLILTISLLSEFT